VTYLNLKHGTYDDWMDTLSMVSENFDAVFVASPVNRANSCYRDLWCKGELTVAGQAIADFLDN